MLRTFNGGPGWPVPPTLRCEEAATCCTSNTSDLRGRLPRLRRRGQSPAWDTYLRRVYGDAVEYPIDLTTFRWFYHSGLPLEVEPARLHIDCAPRHMHGWLGFFTVESLGRSPPGFFVQQYDSSRPGRTAAFPPSSWVEVIRAVPRGWLHPDESTTGATWFWAARGSGVWLNVGRTAVVHADRYRHDWPTWVSVILTKHARELRTEWNDVDTLQCPDASRNRRFEIVVLKRNSTAATIATADTAARSTSRRRFKPLKCHLPYRAGWSHDSECACDERLAVVNCAQTRGLLADASKLHASRRLLESSTLAPPRNGSRTGSSWTKLVRTRRDVQRLSSPKAYPDGFLGGHEWRRAGLDHVIRQCRQPGSDCHQKDVYQFGVYAGLSMRAISKRLRDAGVPFRTLWGFDSFSGLPSENGEQTRTRYIRSAGFQEGAWNIASAWGETDGARIRQRLETYVRDDRVRWVVGYYNETLTPDLASRVAPALYVDMDCDLYSSAKAALDWLFQNRLLVPGSVVGYDDWLQGGRHGVQRAHAEAASQYNASFRSVPQSDSSWPSFSLL